MRFNVWFRVYDLDKMFGKPYMFLTIKYFGWLAGSQMLLNLSLWRRSCYGLSGNVRFFSVEGDIKEVKSGCKVVGFVMTVNSGEIKDSSGLKVDKHGIKYVLKRYITQYYASQSVGGLFCVPPKVGLSGFVYVLPDEKQVVETVLAVARVAKFLAHSPCPVFSIDGSFVELSLVGNEEVIFQQLLIHELSNMRMRNIAGRGENVA